MTIKTLFFFSLCVLFFAINVESKPRKLSTLLFSCICTKSYKSNITSLREWYLSKKDDNKQSFPTMVCCVLRFHCGIRGNRKHQSSPKTGFIHKRYKTINHHCFNFLWKVSLMTLFMLKLKVQAKNLWMGTAFLQCCMASEEIGNINLLPKPGSSTNHIEPSKSSCFLWKVPLITLFVRSAR